MHKYKFFALRFVINQKHRGNQFRNQLVEVQSHILRDLFISVEPG